MDDYVTPVASSGAAQPAAAAEVPTPAGASKTRAQFAKDWAESHPEPEIVSETREQTERQPFQPPSTSPELLNLQGQSSWRELRDQSSWCELFPPTSSQSEPLLPSLHPVPVAVPAPATPSAGVALLRREMVDVKGQPQLMAVLERLVKAAEKQKRREAARDAQQADRALRKPPNLNMVFGGPPGTGKTSSVQKIAKVLAAPEVGVLRHAKVVELNKDTPLPKGGDNVPQKVGRVFDSAKGSILFLDEAHKRTDSSSFVDALVPLLSKHEGEVMVVIAGYKDQIMTWLRNSDQGNPIICPQPNPHPPVILP